MIWYDDDDVLLAASTGKVSEVHGSIEHKHSGQIVTASGQ